MSQAFNYGYFNEFNTDALKKIDTLEIMRVLLNVNSTIIIVTKLYYILCNYYIHNMFYLWDDGTKWVNIIHSVNGIIMLR